MDIYKTSSHSSNVVSIFERDRDNEDFVKACDEILFQVFLHKYKLQYVGEDTPELRREILTVTTTAIAGIKASFVNTRTKRRLHYLQKTFTRK